MPDQLTAPCCQHVLVPIDIRSIGEFDHKAIYDRTHNDRRFVRFATASSDVPDKTERSERGPCQPTGKGIQGVLENDEPALTQLPLKVHRFSLFQTFPKLW